MEASEIQAEHATQNIDQSQTLTQFLNSDLKSP